MLVIFEFQFGFYSIRPSFCLSHALPDVHCVIKCFKYRLFESRVTYGKQTRRTPNKYSQPSTLLLIFNNMHVDLWFTHHVLCFLLPHTLAGAYALAHARGRCSFAGENKMKPDTLVVSRDWMG